MSAGIFAFGQGFIMDIFSTGLLGLFTLLYLMVYWSVNLGSRFFDLNSRRGLFILVTISVSVKGLFFIILLNIFSLEFTLSTRTL